MALKNIRNMISKIEKDNKENDKVAEQLFNVQMEIDSLYFEIEKLENIKNELAIKMGLYDSELTPNRINTIQTEYKKCRLLLFTINDYLEEIKQALAE